MDKQKVLDVYLAYLEKKIQESEVALASIHKGIDTAPTPSESHSDTTRFQQTGVATVMMNRLSSLKTSKASIALMRSRELTAPDIGALIVIEDLGLEEKEYYFVVSGGGGESIELEGTEVLFVSTQAPILEPISKTKVGEPFEFRGRQLALVEIS